MTMFVSASPIPIASPADSLVVARLPEPVDSPLAPAVVEARTVKFTVDSPLTPLDAEARRAPESDDNVPLNVEARTPEQENPEERGCRFACY